MRPFTRRMFQVCYAAFFFSLIFLAGCVSGDARAQKKPLLLDPQFSALRIESISLLPVVFLDDAQDRYYQMRAGEEIRLSTQRKLSDKGYKVAFIDEDADRRFWLPYTSATIDPARLAELAYDKADGVMIIWVDHFLDAGIYDRRAPQALQIYATATLVSSKNRVEIWRGEGFGGGGQMLASPYLVDINLLQVADELAKSLVASLPNAMP